jgi:hypothetical protein
MLVNSIRKPFIISNAPLEVCMHHAAFISTLLHCSSQSKSQLIFPTTKPSTKTFLHNANFQDLSPAPVTQSALGRRYQF